MGGGGGGGGGVDEWFTVCFRWSLATPLKSPSVSNWPGYACFNPSTVLTSGVGLRSSQ